MKDEQIAIGLLLFADSRKKKLDLQDYNSIIKKKEWKLIRMIEDLDIVFSTEDNRVVRIRRDGSIFYIRKFKEQQVPSKELKSMWGEALELIKELNLSIKYENEIDISIHAKNADKVYEINKRSIERFGQNLLHNFSLSVISDKASAFATITPVPETIPFKVLG